MTHEPKLPPGVEMLGIGLEIDINQIDDCSPEATRRYAGLLAFAIEHFYRMPPPCENPAHLDALAEAIQATVSSWLKSQLVLLLADSADVERLKTAWQRDLREAHATLSMSVHPHPTERPEPFPGAQLSPLISCNEASATGY